MKIESLAQKVSLEVQGIELKVQDQLRVVGVPLQFRGPEGEDQTILPAPVAWTDDDGMRIGLRLLTEFNCHLSDVTPREVYASPSVMFYDPVTDTYGSSGAQPEMFSSGAVLWGDGSYSNLLGESSNVTHTYSSAGTYEIYTVFHFAAVAGVSQVFSSRITQSVTVP